MQYIVVPFVASVQNNQGANAVAEQLQNLITQYSQEGYEYLRLEQVDTFVRGSSGCFGMGGSPSYTTSHSVAVFYKK
jgi:hypothetical protein